MRRTDTVASTSQDRTDQVLERQKIEHEMSRYTDAY